MSTRRRIAITVGSALALGFFGAGYAWSGGGVHTTEQIFGIGFLAVYALTVVGVFFVDRWWAVLPALAVVGGPLLGLALNQHDDVYGHDPVVITPFFGALLVVFAIALNAALLSSGLFARLAWRGFRRRRSSSVSPDRSGR